MKNYRNPPDVHPPTGYTHQIELAGPQRTLILSGQIGRSLDGNVPKDSLDQLRVALDNLERNRKAANMGFQDVVKLTYYLVEQMDNQKRRDLIREKIGANPPCSTLVYVAGLAGPDLKVELDAWAIRED